MTMNNTENGKRQKTNGQHFLAPLLLLLAILFLFLATPSCNKKDTLILDYHYDYVPSDSGHYVIYDVDSILYTYRTSPIDSMEIDTIRYQLMEQVGDTVIFNNEVWRELNLYRRTNSSSPWVFDRKWDIRHTTTTYSKREDDNWFIKFVFPPTEGEQWNGNAYLPTTQDYRIFLDWDYHYQTLHEPYTVNGLSFDSTITVSETDNQNAIEKVLRKEVYANGVGMIYQEWESLTFAVSPNPNWETGDINGWRIRMKVNSYGP